MSKPQNRLLAALPEEVHERLYPHLEDVSLLLGQVIYESGERLDHIYFPTTSIVSLLYTMEDGTSAEIGVVGAVLAPSDIVTGHLVDQRSKFRWYPRVSTTTFPAPKQAKARAVPTDQRLRCHIDQGILPGKSP